MTRSPRAGNAAGSRAGTTLLELLVALPILAIVGGMAVAVLLAAQRQARAADARHTVGRELRHGGLVMAAELRPLQPDDLVAWSDTGIELHSLVGTGIACDTRDGRRTVNLLPVGGDDPARAAWISPAEPGDRVSVWLAASSSTDSSARWTGVLDAVSSSNACSGAPLGLGAARATLLTLRDSLPRSVEQGSPVRITRRVRYALYRAADREWYLGRSASSGAAWEVVQPVVGPLLPAGAAASGVEIAVLDSALVPLRSGDSTAAVVHIGFRARRSGAAPSRVDSSFTTVALRGRSDE